MPAQPSSPGPDAAPVATDRLFFAVFPDADSAERIARLAQQLRGEHDLKGRPLALGRFHVTLHHLGDYVGVRPDIVAMADAAAAAVSMPPFNVLFDCAASFSSTPRNRPFVLRGGDGLAALMAFQQALGMAMKRTGLGCQVKSGYTPHVTLLYDDRCVTRQAVDPIRWTVREFVLVHSLLGRSLHVPIARWPLRG